jgi:PadR family transcriptional regulator AphA
MSSLTPTARVILGMLKLGIPTGYDIKKAIDTSTRFFWGASFGQIYPELKRLRRAGLVRAEQQPRGKVKRTAYSLTPKGERALHDWLTDTETFTFEMRDEGLLRLFFGDALSREEVVANLRSEAGYIDEALARFREIEVDARTGFAAEDQLHPYLALLYGIGLTEWMRDWRLETAKRLEEGAPLIEVDDDEAAGGKAGLGATG